MRFLVKGRVFDTAKSDVVAQCHGEYVPNEFEEHFGAIVHYEDVLYRTGKSVFWLHEHHTVQYPDCEPVISDDMILLDSVDDAVRWVELTRAGPIHGSSLPSRRGA